MAASSINFHAYSDALVVLGTAAVVIPLVRRMRVSPVLGYLGAGAVLGPVGLGSFIDKIPFLQWLTITDAENVAGIAELGVVFLLFLIGMELSYERLKAMHRLIFGLGSLQIAISAAAIGSIAVLMGNSLAVAIIIGASLALSSTAIVVEVLSNQGRLGTMAGRASFAVLLAQDLAVVPIILFVSILAARESSSVLHTLFWALANAALALGAIVIVGHMLLRPLFRQVAKDGGSDLFVAAALFVVVGTGVASALAGVSMGLGAFVAGLLLAETEFHKAIETTIEPFKGLFLGLFFFTIGMSIDFRELAREPWWSFASVTGLIGIKFVILTALCRLFRIPMPAAIETGLLLGPGGEFAFVAIGMATVLGLIKADVSSFTLAVTSVTMALIPLLALLARRVTPRFHKPDMLDPELAVGPHEEHDHAIVIGYGRVGQVVCALLEYHKFPHIAIDSDATMVPELRRRGRNVFYGDAFNPELLKRCDLMRAKAVIITINAPKGIDEVVRQVRSLRPDILIVSRARDALHASHLYTIGVSDAVPETIEASLQLSEATLMGLGVPAGLVIASIHEKRDEMRREMQQAAGRAGLTKTHSIRAKTSHRIPH